MADTPLRQVFVLSNHSTSFVTLDRPSSHILVLSVVNLGWGQIHFANYKYIYFPMAKYKYDSILNVKYKFQNFFILR